MRFTNNMKWSRIYENVSYDSSIVDFTYYKISAFFRRFPLSSSPVLSGIFFLRKRPSTNIWEPERTSEKSSTRRETFYVVKFDHTLNLRLSSVGLGPCGYSHLQRWSAILNRTDSSARPQAAVSPWVPNVANGESQGVWCFLPGEEEEEVRSEKAFKRFSLFWLLLLLFLFLGRVLEQQVHILHNWQNDHQ